MTFFKDIMPYFDELLLVYGLNLRILWYPLKICTPQNLTIANFRHPVSKSLLSPCEHLSIVNTISWSHLYLLHYQNIVLSVLGSRSMFTKMVILR